MIMRKPFKRNGKRIVIGLCLSLSVAMFASGCTSSDPLERLKSDSLDTSMSPDYWKAIEKQKPDVWKQATAYCFAHGNDHPNCEIVTDMAVIENGRTTAPQIGHSGNYVTMPTHLDY